MLVIITKTIQITLNCEFLRSSERPTLKHHKCICYNFWDNPLKSFHMSFRSCGKKRLPQIFECFPKYKIILKIKNSKTCCRHFFPNDRKAMSQNFKGIFKKLWKKIGFWCFKVGLSLERRNLQFGVILLVF